MILVLNLKMNLSKNKVIEYENNIKNKNVIVLPQYPYLTFFNGDVYRLGSQDVSEHQKGSYTGEVCAKCLSDLGCKYGLVCHYEREKYFNENLTTSKNKIINLVEHDIIPIYCINDNGNINIEDKLSILCGNVNKIIIAYEAIWLIGNNLNKEDIIYIKEQINNIKQYLNKLNIDFKIIYGGGLNENNIKYILTENLVDGFIISSNVLEIESLNRIYDLINN